MAAIQHDRRLPKLSAKARNDRKWESLREIIQSVYVNHTLKETMEIIRNSHDFKASERKWKEKIKSWKFEKNVSSASMSILVAKSEKRKRECGKETLFFHGGVRIRPQRIENFRKRRTMEVDPVSPSAETRLSITYCTPSPGTPLPPTHLSNEPLSDTASVEEEVKIFLPDPSHGSGKRNMLIQTIAKQSMLWDCPGRGLHTMDEESVIGLDDEILAPTITTELIAEHIKGARLDVDKYATKSAAIKYLGSIILALERKCCGTELLSEFLEFLEAGPGAYVLALRQLSERPIFHVEVYSDVWLLYQEVLSLLCAAFHRTSEVVLRMCILLANLKSLYWEISFHAVTLYEVAIEGYERMGKFYDMLDCQLSLADVMLGLNRASDAYELLARSCGMFLRDRYRYVDETLTVGVYTLSSLSSPSMGVRSSIFRIKHIVSQSLKDFEDSNRDTHYIMMIYEIAALGGILSTKASESDSVLYLEALDPLWSEIFTQLSLLSDTNFFMLKAFAYLQRSNYLCNGFNLFRHHSFVEDFYTAGQYLAKGNHFSPQLKDEYQRHYVGLQIRARSIPHLSTLDMMDAFSIARLSDVSENWGDVTPSRPAAAVLTFPRDAHLQTVLGDTGDCLDSIFDIAISRKKYGVCFSDGRKWGLVFTD